MTCEELKGGHRGRDKAKTLHGVPVVLQVMLTTPAQFIKLKFFKKQAKVVAQSSGASCPDFV